MGEKKKYSILVIDDDRFLLDMYMLKFKEQGFEVISALGSVDAMAKIQEGKISPDIVLLDIVMPTMDGFEFLEKVRKDGLLKDSLIIVLSNLGQQVDIDRARNLGVSGYIVKASATPTEVVKQVLDIAEGKKDRA